MNFIRVGELSHKQIEQCLRGDGLTMIVGIFRCLIRSDTGLLTTPIRLLYKDYLALERPYGFYDFHIGLRRTRSSFLNPWEVQFDLDGDGPFPALPLAHAHPLFEWGLNWCVANASGMHTVIHSAVLERDGLALILPGLPGSGKSTLCAALSLSDWRLLSDELTVVSQDDGKVQALPRPISLKNSSINLIRERFPSVEITGSVIDTHKGEIAYVQPPSAAVAAGERSANIGYVVFPKFMSGANLDYEQLTRAEALAELMSNTFNVGLLGAEGFSALAEAIADAECYMVEYGDLSTILNWVDKTCRPKD